MPTQTTLLTIIVFIVQIISHVKATISNTKLIKFNREYGFNLTANELKGVFGFSASGEALSVTSVPNGPSMNQLEQVQTNDVLVSINGGQSVHPTDIMDALKDLDELLSFLRKSPTAGMIFPRLLDSKLQKRGSPEKGSRVGGGETESQKIESRIEIYKHHDRVLTRQATSAY